MKKILAAFLVVLFTAGIGIYAEDAPKTEKKEEKAKKTKKAPKKGDKASEKSAK
jgi:uncharacterized protein YxeA